MIYPFNILIFFVNEYDFEILQNFNGTNILYNVVLVQMRETLC